MADRICLFWTVSRSRKSLRCQFLCCLGLWDGNEIDLKHTIMDTDNIGWPWRITVPVFRPEQMTRTRGPSLTQRKAECFGTSHGPDLQIKYLTSLLAGLWDPTKMLQSLGFFSSLEKLIRICIHEVIRSNIYVYVAICLVQRSHELKNNIGVSLACGLVAHLSFLFINVYFFAILLGKFSLYIQFNNLFRM